MPTAHFIFHKFRHVNFHMIENSVSFAHGDMQIEPFLLHQDWKQWNMGVFIANQLVVFISMWYLIIYDET